MKKVNILLVEDNIYDSESTLRKLNYMDSIAQVTRVANGEEALQYLFKKGPYKLNDKMMAPDLVLLDLLMPKVSGMEVLKKIKEEGTDEIRNTPVVVLTSVEDNSINKECFALGAKGYLLKPIQPNYLTDFLIRFNLIN